MTDCARCGDCCENIPFRLALADITAKLANPYLAGRNRRDLTYIAAHWTPNGNSDANPTTYECAKFDRATRTCTAHADRPPICQDYPHYRRPLPDDEGLRDMSPRCSFVADHVLPSGASRLLPLVEVR